MTGDLGGWGWRNGCPFPPRGERTSDSKRMWICRLSETSQEKILFCTATNRYSGYVVEKSSKSLRDFFSVIFFVPHSDPEHHPTDGVEVLRRKAARPKFMPLFLILPQFCLLGSWPRSCCSLTSHGQSQVSLQSLLVFPCPHLHHESQEGAGAALSAGS